jgi:hypothetical protein
MNPMKWIVRLRSIEWDDGKGEYDVSGLPSSLDIVASGSDANHAIDRAMDYVSDYYGFLMSAAATARQLD